MRSPADVGDEDPNTVDKFQKVIFLGGYWYVLEGVVEVDSFHVPDTDSAQ